MGHWLNKHTSWHRVNASDHVKVLDPDKNECAHIQENDEINRNKERCRKLSDCRTERRPICKCIKNK